MYFFTQMEKSDLQNSLEEIGIIVAKELLKAYTADFLTGLVQEHETRAWTSGKYLD